MYLIANNGQEGESKAAMTVMQVARVVKLGSRAGGEDNARDAKGASIDGLLALS